MAIQAMNIAIKNNNLMRTKRERFKKTMGGYGKNRKPEYDLPEANPKLLRDIRRRLKKENQILWIKIIGVTVVILIALVWMVFAT